MKVVNPAEELRVLVGCEMSGRVRDAFAARGWEAVSADILPTERPVWHTMSPSEGIDSYDQLAEHCGLTTHYQGDVRDLFDWNHPLNRERQRRCYNHFYRGSEDPPVLWDLAIMFPPCTDLSLAGARFWRQKQADGRQQAAADFFMQMIQSPALHVAVENPRGWMNNHYRQPDQIVEPWWFGAPLVKQTCFWTKNLPPLIPTHSRADYPQLFRIATGGGSWRTDTAAGRRAMSAYEDSEGRKNRAKVRSRTIPEVAQAIAAQWGSFMES